MWHDHTQSLTSLACKEGGNPGNRKPHNLMHCNTVFTRLMLNVKGKQSGTSIMIDDLIIKILIIVYMFYSFFVISYNVSSQKAIFKIDLRMEKFLNLY